MESLTYLVRYAGAELVETVLSSAAKRLMEHSMTHKAHVVHHIPGRVRLRVPAKRRHHAFFHDVKQRLEGCDAVSSVAVNPASGSVLIRYEGSIEELLAQAAVAGLLEFLEVTEELPLLEPIADQLVESLGHVDRHITRSTGGALDGRSALLIAFVAAAVWQSLRGQLFGPAVPLLWYAAQALSGTLSVKSPHQSPQLTATAH
jgi:hypothetical protein